MTNPTVLVVDNDPEIVEFLECALVAAGYAVLQAVDGAAALQVAHDALPDVILLDIVMPGMDGVEACHALRADPATAAIPIIALSVLGPRHARRASMPANDHLRKPFALALLYDTVARWTAPTVGALLPG